MDELGRQLARGASPEIVTDLDTAMSWMRDYYGLTPRAPVLSSEDGSGHRSGPR